MKKVFSNLNLIGFVAMVVGLLLYGLTSYGTIGLLLAKAGLLLYAIHSAYIILHWKDNTKETNLMSFAGLGLSCVLLVLSFFGL